MRRIKMWGVAILAGWLMSAGVGWSADAPKTNVVLGKLHHSNEREISMARLAEKSGASRGLKDFGRTLAKDHEAADRKVVALAAQEKIDLAASTPAMTDADMAGLPVDVDFDARFAKVMLDDHVADLGQATAIREATHDQRLRALLDELIPLLRSHRDQARRIVDSIDTRASL